jgi:hypothetical protein
MSQSNFWKREEVPFNNNIYSILKNFRSSDLGDPELSRRWIEFAKDFSQMSLSPNDIEQMNFESFYALKQIMATTLTSLSEETVKQSDKIASLDQEESVLKRNLQNLQRI